jgi:serine/threonine protein kinase
VIERLGKGSFGSVYLVEKKSTKNTYAMKVLEKQKVLKQNLVRYALTERNVLCLASHPFIVSLNFAFQSS